MKKELPLSAANKIEKILQIAPVPRNRDEVVKHDKDVVTRVLNVLGATKLEMEYDGGGDDGGVQSVKVLKGKTELPLGSHEVDYYKAEDKYDFKTNGKYTCKTIINKARGPFEEMLHEFAYQVIDTTGFDTINNEGGYGTVVLDLKTNKLTLKHCQRPDGSHKSRGSVRKPIRVNKEW